MFPKKFAYFSLTICLLFACLLTIQAPADNENGEQHTHVIVTTTWGYCWCPLPSMSLPKVDHEGCILVYMEGGFEWTSFKTCFETHGIANPECPAQCGYDVCSEDDHLDYCTTCYSHYYTCQETHNSVQCGNVYH